MLQQKLMDDLNLIGGHDVWQALKDGLAIGIEGKEIEHATGTCAIKQTIS